jgi:hypothetical protein
MKTNIKKGTLRVWWIPQVPMKPFYVFVDSPSEAKKILNVLAEYDIFQYENSVKPDYSNAGGLEEYDGREWSDWYDEEGNDLDDWVSP